jgi:hypothetical protein
VAAAATAALSAPAPPAEAAARAPLPAGAAPRAPHRAAPAGLPHRAAPAGLPHRAAPAGLPVPAAPAGLPLPAAAAGRAPLPAAAAAEGDPVVVREGRDARAGGLDLTRVQLGRSADGRLRAALTLAAGWTAATLVARAEPPNPPGSVCLRLWTVSATRGRPADFLVCVTADRRGRRLRAGVLREGADGLPERVAPAQVGRASSRTVTLRFSQSAVRRPARVRFAAEATRPGCVRTSCVDTAPDAPATADLVLRRRAG